MIAAPTPKPKHAPVWFDVRDLRQDISRDVIVLIGDAEKIAQRTVSERRKGSVTIWRERLLHLEPGRFGIRYSIDQYQGVRRQPSRDGGRLIPANGPICCQGRRI